MNETSEALPNLLSNEPFEIAMRGYAKRQVDDYVARTRNQVRDLEERLARSLDENEHFRQELHEFRQQPGARPAHEEMSERLAQILKLAEEEADQRKADAHAEIDERKAMAQAERERIINEARDQTERMLTAAQQQAEYTVSSAREEADRAMSGAKAEAERTLSSAHDEAENALVTAKTEADRLLRDSQVRAAAINDGAGHRLTVLTDTHAEAVRRLTEIRDVLADLLHRDNSAGTLEDTIASLIAAKNGTTPPTPATESVPEPVLAPLATPADLTSNLTGNLGAGMSANLTDDMDAEEPEPEEAPELGSADLLGSSPDVDDVVTRGGAKDVRIVRR